MGNIRKGGGFNPDGKKAFVPAEHASGLRRFLLNEGDILMCMTDMKANVALLGHTARMPESGRYLVNQRVGRITVRNPEVLDQRFLYYYSNNPEYIDWLRSHANSGVQVNLSTEAILNSPIACPPLPIQRRIACILSAYDELIENSQRRIKILEAMARALYREWFVHFRFPGHESVPRVPTPLGEIPQGWEVKKLGDLCTLAKDAYRDAHHSELPLLDLARMPSSTLAPQETGKPSELTTSRIVFQQGDTLFGAIRCYLHKVVVMHYSGVTNTSVLVLRPKRASFRSLLAVIASDAETIRWAETQSTGTKMPVINWGVFQMMPTPIPAQALAEEYENLVGPMLDEIGALATQVQNLRRTRDLLLPRLFSGQIDVEALPT
jgi:type I restriction enzyme S subunit